MGKRRKAKRRDLKSHYQRTKDNEKDFPVHRAPPISPQYTYCLPKKQAASGANDTRRARRGQIPLWDALRLLPLARASVAMTARTAAGMRPLRLTSLFDDRPTTNDDRACIRASVNRLPSAVYRLTSYFLSHPCPSAFICG
jgi:hypothetical protein